VSYNEQSHNAEGARRRDGQRGVRSLYGALIASAMAVALSRPPLNDGDTGATQSHVTL
jgi:hypothetical protein